jgi:hypothetical protein
MIEFGTTEIVIFDQLGRTVKTVTAELHAATKLPIELRLPEGQYFLTANTKDQSVTLPFVYCR